MNCPKCGKELLNVNGKYVCVDCGIEVPEGEASTPQSLPEQASPEATPTPEVATTDPVTSSAQTETPVGNTASSVPSINDVPIEKPAETEVPEPEVATLDTSVPISEMQPKSPNAEATVSELAPSTAENSEENQVAPSVQPTEALPVNDSIAAPAVDAPIPPVTANIETPSAETGPVVPESSGLDLKQESAPVDPFDQVNNTEMPLNQSGSTASVDTIQPSQTPVAPSQPDPAIFQDPMYDNTSPDQQLPPSTPSSPTSFNQQPQASVTPPADNTKKLKIVLFVGIVAAVLLLIGGFIAYLLLT